MDPKFTKLHLLKGNKNSEKRKPTGEVGDLCLIMRKNYKAIANEVFSVVNIYLTSQNILALSLSFAATAA